jgi:quercetin dioxygenase-like cupin family protein
MKKLLYIVLITNSLLTMAQDSDVFSINELYTQAKEEGGSYLKFLDNDRLSSGIYQLKAGEVDTQEPHAWDEVYYILEGKAKLEAGDKTHRANQGDILFVAAQVVHRFVEIETDLKILVFFSKKK